MDDKKDLLNLDDIRNLVDSFYGKVRSDELLAPIFNERIQDKWPVHLEKMYRFWQTVLLGEHTYMGSPFPPHANLPVDKSHFEQWLKLFRQTLDEQFSGEKAKEAKWRADKMAEMFLLRIDYFREQGFKSII
jgi:hemoglobin